jgi:diguanylate cyclase (GGDEF)-like protein
VSLTVDSATGLARVRQLLLDGRCNEAVALVDRIAATAPNGAQRADALALRLAGIINLRRSEEYAATLDAAFDAARRYPDTARWGLLHSFAALVAHHDGSLERCVWHLVLSARALGSVELNSPDIVRAWHNLAMSYSYTGFHGHARAAIDKARRIAGDVGLPTVPFAAPSIRLRAAVSLDQHGDTEACVRILRDLVQDLTQRKANGELAMMRPISLRAYGYAVVRLAALGDRKVLTEHDAMPLLDSEDDSTSARDFAVLGAVCLAIAERTPIEAVARLEIAQYSIETLGPAEGHRLRALAHVAAGDHASAYCADRQAFRVASTFTEQLRERLVDGMAARVDHQSLSRSVSRYAGQAHTDPLTGLPNRRYLEQYVSEIVERSDAAVLGVCDLDGFKAVNTVHGHLSGDLVLQRVAGILNRVMRRRDFVARYGGDEFVVVMPAASLAEAHEVARRVRTAVAAEDWEALVPGTPVGVTIGWAPISADGYTTVAEAFEAADHEMLRAKARPRAS